MRENLCTIAMPILLAVHRYSAMNVWPRSSGLPNPAARLKDHVMRGVCYMSPQILFEQLQAKVSEVLSRSPAQDVEKNLKAMLSAFFARLDLVTREEFDIQRQVLLRTREKLEQLEAKLAEIERSGGQDHA